MRGTFITKSYRGKIFAIFFVRRNEKQRERKVQSFILFLKLPRPGDNEVTFRFSKSSYHLLLVYPLKGLRIMLPPVTTVYPLKGWGNPVECLARWEQSIDNQWCYSLFSFINYRFVSTYLFRFPICALPKNTTSKLADFISQLLNVKQWSQFLKSWYNCLAGWLVRLLKGTKLGDRPPPICLLVCR